MNPMRFTSETTTGEPIGAHLASYNTELSVRAVPEWRATLDALQELAAPVLAGRWERFFTRHPLDMGATKPI
jgi:hypothetical protein